MASEDYNAQLDTQVNYQAYQPFVPTDVQTINGLITTGAVTTLNGDGGASTSGPVVSITGGVTGLTFTTGGASVTLTGTLALTHGGTGAVTAAAARTNLEVARLHTALVAPAVTDDGAAGYPIGTSWIDTVLKDAYVSVDASAGAAVWKKTTP